eukprot:1151965-Pelagomonas_calceolata.AAC.4
MAAWVLLVHLPKTKRIQNEVGMLTLSLLTLSALGALDDVDARRSQRTCTSGLASSGAPQMLCPRCWMQHLRSWSTLNRVSVFYMEVTNIFMGIKEWSQGGATGRFWVT